MTNFSDRTPKNMVPNRISAALHGRKPSSYLDLTLSNPTQCQFNYPAGLLKTLSDPRSLVYEPEPFGHPAARKAVAEYLASKGQKVDPENILLTASTSEAYSFLFKLLGNPGDSILAPTPGYPLLEHLTQLDSLEALPYRLRMEAGWPVDLNQLQKAVRPQTKGFITVNPHNPTGCFLSPADQKSLLETCRRHSLAYISDEVFADFCYSRELYPAFNSEGILCFRLGGLSKSLGLPQLKLSWVAMDGPTPLLSECRERLELIADTYLSVGTPIQWALKDLFQFAPVFQKQVLERVLKNRNTLENGLKKFPYVRAWPAQGGWYALVEVAKAGASDEELVLGLLEKESVFVQPGGFYDFSEGCFLVLSLLPEEDRFREGATRLANYLSRS